MKTMNRMMTITLSALVLLLAACGRDKEPEVNVSGVSLNSTSLRLKVNESEILRATVSPAEATNKAVVWNSSAPSVASVSDDGTVTALKEGTATITVTTAKGGKEDTCVITVEEDVPPLAVANNAAFEIPAMTTGVRIADVNLAGAVSGGKPPYTFSLTSGTLPKGISLSNGVISGAPTDPAAEGTVKITVGDFSTPPQTKEVTVRYGAVSGESTFIPVTSITDVPARLVVGKNRVLPGTVNPGNATHREIRWSLVEDFPGATIGGNKLNTTTIGKVKLRATIPNGKSATTDYTEDFDVEIYETLVILVEQPESEADITKSVTLTQPVELIVNAETYPAGRAVQYQWYMDFGSGFVAINNATGKVLKFTPTQEGRASFHCILSADGAADQHWPIAAGNPAFITITTSNYNFVPVTDIVNVPSTTRTGIPLDLSGAVVYPDDASVKSIKWEMAAPGQTGGTIITTQNGNSQFLAWNRGTATVRATVSKGKSPTEDYTKTFTIQVTW